MRSASAAVLGGTGPFGSALARRLAASGMRVTIGSRDPTRAEAVAARIASPGLTLAGAANRAAAAGAESVFLAAPFSGQAALLTDLAPELDGKLVVCCAVIWPPRSRPETSAAEDAARVLAAAGAKDARVAAAFQTVAAGALSTGPGSREGPDILVFADRPEDGEAAAEVCSRVGLRALPAGPLEGARAAEALVGVLIHLNRSGARGAGLRITGV